MLAAKAVGVALAPLEGLVWGYDQCKAFISAKVAAKLATKPVELIQPPEKIIAGPLLLNLAFASDAPHLKELYANLLANAMHVPTATRVHPSFVQIIQQLTPAEARILKTISQRWTGPDLLFQERIASLSFSSGYDFLSAFFGPDEKIAEKWNCLCAEREVIDTEMSQLFLRNLIRLGILHANVARGMQAGLLSTSESNGDLTRELRLTEYGDLFLELCVRDEPVHIPTGEGR